MYIYIYILHMYNTYIYTLYIPRISLDNNTNSAGPHFGPTAMALTLRTLRQRGHMVALIIILFHDACMGLQRITGPGKTEISSVVPGQSEISSKRYFQTMWGINHQQ